MAYFKRGDFIKYKVYNDNITFGIFEGNDVSFSEWSKKYSLALYYESKKYCQDPEPSRGWDYREVLDTSNNTKHCAKVIDTLVEDSWWSLCDEKEKKNAIATLERLHYHWDEKNLTLTSTETNEVVYKIHIPQPPSYNGEVVKPTACDLKTKLKHAVKKKNKSFVYF